MAAESRTVKLPPERTIRAQGCKIFLFVKSPATMYVGGNFPERGEILPKILQDGNAGKSEAKLVILREIKRFN